MQGLGCKCFHKVGRSVLNYNKRRGYFCKKVKRWEVSLLNRGKVRGFWAYCPVFSLLPHRGTEEGKALIGGGRFGRSGPRRRPGVEGRGGRGSAGSIPGRGSDRGGPRWPSHGGRRQRAAVVLGRWPWAMIADGGRGKAEWGGPGSDSRPHLEPRRRAEVGRRGRAAAALATPVAVLGSSGRGGTGW